MKNIPQTIKYVIYVPTNLYYKLNMHLLKSVLNPSFLTLFDITNY